MDTDLLKTFLAVERTRHFGKAANTLCITQSAVSARIRLLEETLGVTLFVRNRHNIQLSDKGQRLLKHARAILHQWDETRRALAIEEETPRPILRIGGVFSLWDVTLQQWIQRLYQHIPDLSIHAEVETEDVMVRKLSDGVLDVGFFLEAPQNLDLVCREICTISLILVSSQTVQAALTYNQIMEDHYILLDWGTHFTTWHRQHFPDLSTPMMQVNLGRVALHFLLQQPSSAYLAEPLCQTYLDTKILRVVTDAPRFEYKLHALYSPHNVRLALLEDALSFLIKN